MLSGNELYIKNKRILTLDDLEQGAKGIAPLDENGKVPNSCLPSSSSSITDVTVNDLSVVENTVAKLVLPTDFSILNAFSYVIDSQAKFNNWVNNVAGNDYSYVAIIGGKGSGTNGRYETSLAINLTTTGTKGIQGFSNAIIYSSATTAAIKYDTRPDLGESFIKDIQVISYGSSAFHNCSNLINCIGFNDAKYADAFAQCAYLTNCISTGIGKSGGRGFYQCNYLTNCIGNATATNGPAHGFYSCKYLTNCIGNAEGFGNYSDAISFYDCNYLTNCTGNATGNSSCFGFRGCAYLTNCIGTGNGGANGGVGFYQCNYLTECGGGGICTSGNGYGFYGCYLVNRCCASSHCTTQIFVSCYANSTLDNTFEVDMTANGGFNNTTTNPS